MFDVALASAGLLEAVVSYLRPHGASGPLQGGAVGGGSARFDLLLLTPDHKHRLFEQNFLHEPLIELSGPRFLLW